jgi:cytochrome c oxidase subunit 3
MPATKVLEEIELVVEDRRGNGGDKPPADGHHGGDDGGGRDGRPFRHAGPARYYTGITVVMISVLMFFMALVSAYVVRKGASSDWVPLRFPALLWFNTVVLLLSSLTLEVARRQLTQSDFSAFRRWWTITTALGVVFLVGQLVVWRELFAQGVFVSTNPASSFFYVFTGAHAVHVVGAVAALFFVALRNFDRAKVSRSTAVGVTSYFWHFLDGLWVFLAVLLYFGR